MKLDPRCDFCQERRPVMGKVVIRHPGYHIVSNICGNCRRNSAVPSTAEELLRHWGKDGSRAR